MKATYKCLPYVRPYVGDVISADQMADMEKLGNWECFPTANGLAVDFADFNGLRSDWLEIDNKAARFLTVSTFSGNAKYYLVTHTSY